MTDQLTRDELLTLLIEECAEVIQAATKCLRFGYTTSYPGYGRNDYAVSREIGDVLGIIDALELDGALTKQPLELARRNKILKAVGIKAEVARRVQRDQDAERELLTIWSLPTE